MSESKKKEVKSVVKVDLFKGRPTDPVKVICVKAHGKLVKDKVYTVSIDIANVLITRKLVKKA